MDTTIDARGLSCPQPVLMTLEAIKTRDKGDVVILIDTDTSRENVIRAAASQGWQVKDVRSEDMGCRLTIAKS